MISGEVMQHRRWRRRFAAASRRALVCLGVASLAFTLSPALAETPKWGAHLDFEGRWGNSRSLGDAGLFAPLWQDQTSLLFADIRGRFDSNDGREGNFGIGYRRMLGNGWNIGGYGYLDVRRTSLNNTFQQTTLGIEALSADWDVRANVYAPFGSRSREIGVTGGNPFADFAGGTIQIVTPGQYQLLERALTGVDGEIGWRAPVFDVDALTQVRLYGGGFYFDGGGVTRDIAGPRGRVEFSIDGVLGLSPARLTLGAEVQHDDVRGTQGFAIARLRVPLHGEKAAPRLSAQERRMTERVVRDVDIVSDVGRGAQTKAEVREAAINTWNNQTVTDVVQVTASTQGNLQSALNAHGAGSVVILNGAITSANAPTGIQANQSLIGGGTVLALTGVTTGTAVNFIAPGAQGSLTGAALPGVVVMAPGSVLGGMTISNTDMSGPFSSAVEIANADRAVVFGNTITTSGSYSTGVNISDSNNAVVTGNSVTTAGDLGHGISALFSDDVTISFNTVVTGGLGAAGIGVESSNRAIVRSNTINTTGDSGSGVVFSTSNDVAISNNVIVTTGADAYGVIGIGSAGGFVGGNAISTSGTDAVGLYALSATTLTVQNNAFGPVDAQAIFADSGSSFVSAGSTGNSAPAGGTRCASIGAPSSGTVFFADGVNCVYP